MTPDPGVRVSQECVREKSGAGSLDFERARTRERESGKGMPVFVTEETDFKRFGSFASSPS